MTRFFTLSVISLFVLCTSSCSESGAVEEAFTTIVNIHASEDRGELEEYFDKGTHRFIEQLVEYAKAGKITNAQYLGQENEVPISTLLLYYALTGSDGQADSTNVFASKEFIWLYFTLDGTGVFRHTAEQPIKIHDGAEFYTDTKAELNVSVPTGSNARLGTTYLFHKEKDQWKLNFPSTMRIMEKIHVQNQRRNRLSITEYARQQSQQSGDELQFQYRKYQ